MKRFYTAVDTAPDSGGFVVRLDGKPVRTPARKALATPTQGLAAAVAAEWAAQAEQVDANGMPLTRLAATALDLIPQRRRHAIEEAAGFSATDLLCYRAAEPAALAARQHEGWQPWLDWVELRFGARLLVTDTIDPIPQLELSTRALRGVVERQDDWRLTGLHAAVTATGSLVLGLAMLEGRLDAERALGAALLDELFEIERWGQERDQQRRHTALRRDLGAAADYLRLLSA